MKDQSQTQTTDSFKEVFAYLTLNSSFFLNISLFHEKRGYIETDITVPLSNNIKSKNVELSKRAIKSLLENPNLCRYYAEQGRLRYLQNFSFVRFKQHMRLYFQCDT